MKDYCDYIKRKAKLKSSHCESKILLLFTKFIILIYRGKIMSKKLLKIVALSAIIFSFSANAHEVKSGWTVEAGGGKTITGDNKNITFHFGTITQTNGGITTTAPVISHIKEFEHHDSFVLFTALNYNFCNGFALGAEISYALHDEHSKNGRSNNEKAKLANQSLTLLAKGKYYIDLGGQISPFIGAGIGIARMSIDFNDGINSFSDLKKTKFAYMGTAGLMLDTAKDIQLSLAYSVRGTKDIEKDYHCGEESHGKLTGFSDLKNMTQSIEASVGFKI